MKFYNPIPYRHVILSNINIYDIKNNVGWVNLSMGIFRLKFSWKIGLKIVV